MKMKHSTTWKSSKKPEKQRKYRRNAPKHVLGKFLKVHLSKELKKKYNKRSIRARKGDRVKVMKGQFKGKSGKIESVDTNKFRYFIEGVEIQKKEGTKVRYPISSNNLMLTELNFDDKKRQEKLRIKNGKKAS